MTIQVSIATHVNEHQCCDNQLITSLRSPFRAEPLAVETCAPWHFASPANVKGLPAFSSTCEQQDFSSVVRTQLGSLRHETRNRYDPIHGDLKV